MKFSPKSAPFALVALVVPMASAFAAPVKPDNRYENIETFQKVLHFVEQNYVDPVENRQLMQGAIKGMLETLDPHSNFLPADVFRDMKIETSGKFGGIGIEIGMKENVLTVVTPIEDTPAWKAGIKPNDRIVKINLKGVSLGSQIFGKYLVERGQGGSIINLGSMSGIVPLSRVFTYSATKAAVHNLSKNLAREWAPQRVRVNTLVPGFFPAEQNRKILNPDRVASIMRHTPMNRFGEATLIDGFFVNGSAKLVGVVANIVRHFQTGYLYQYAFTMIIGVFALLTLWFFTT